jgi:hypothetical protein
VVLARNPSDSAALLQEPFAEMLIGKPEAKGWTDDFSNILSVFKW